MKKVFILTLILLGFFSKSTFAEQKKQASIFYEQCNILVDKNQKENISSLGENLCLFIEDKNLDGVILLSKKNNNFGLEKIKQNYLDYLKKNYYRGEKIEVFYYGKIKNLKQKLKFNNYDKYYTLKNNYKIDFLYDELLENYPTLKKNCEFNSFYPKCEDRYKQNLTQQINDIITKNILNRNEILKSSKEDLKLEIKKINFISNKIKNLENYYKNKKTKIYGENIKFTFSFLLYKFDIYEKILNNRLRDLSFSSFLKENQIYFIDKKLVGDLFISQNDKFTFFYYKDKRVNTLKNSLSHFDQDELQEDKNLSLENIEYVKEKIRDKYSAYFVKNTNNRFIFILKKYKSKEKYLLFDTKTEILYSFDGKIIQLEKGKNGYYFLVKDYLSKTKLLLLKNKKLYTIIDYSPNFSLYGFELLSGKKVKVLYSNSDKKHNETIIDISDF